MVEEEREEENEWDAGIARMKSGDWAESESKGAAARRDEPRDTLTDRLASLTSLGTSPRAACCPHNRQSYRLLRAPDAQDRRLDLTQGTHPIPISSSLAPINTTPSLERVRSSQRHNSPPPRASIDRPILNPRSISHPEPRRPLAR